MRPMLALLTILTMLSVIVPPASLAGQATPPSGLAPARCVREPRTIDEVRALAGVRENAVVIRSFGELSDALPSGLPVEPATAEEIRATLDEFAACILSGELLRSYAYFSDRFMRDAGPLAEEYVAILAGSPTPEPDQTFYSIDTVSRIERLADGRVGAVVTAGGGCERSQPEPTCTFYALFVQEDGRWSIDEQIRELRGPDGFLTVSEYLEQQETPVATPVR